MKRRWRDLLSMLADVATVVSAVAVLLAGGGYAVGRLSQAWQVPMLVGLVAALVTLVYLRRRAWWRATRPRYASCVARLAKPAREEVLARLRGDEVLRLGEETRQRLPKLEVDALRVLQFALAALDSAGDGPCVLDAYQLFPGRGYAAVPDAQNSCRELVEAGIVSRYEVSWGDGTAKV